MLKAFTLGVVTSRGEDNTHMWWLVNWSALPMTKSCPQRNYTQTELVVNHW